MEKEKGALAASEAEKKRLSEELDKARKEAAKAQGELKNLQVIFLKKESETLKEYKWFLFFFAVRR